MRVIIDADSAPDRLKLAEAVAALGIEAIMVMSVAHYSDKAYGKNIKIVLVDSRRQEADIKICNMAVKGDIVITNDSGLSLVIAGKGAYVINHSGKILGDDEAQLAVNRAYAVKKAVRGRKETRSKVKGPKKIPAGKTAAATARITGAVEKIIRGSKNL